MQEPSGEGKRSFWITTPGVLTSIAGLIAAIAAVLGVLNEAGVLGGGEGTATSTPAATVTPPRTDQPPEFAYEAVADAFVDRSRPFENHGKDTTLEVDGNPMQITFLRFVVENLAVPVMSAQLWLICVSEQRGGAPLGGSVWTASGSWTETEITWKNKPDLEEQVVSVAMPVDCLVDQVVPYNVTDFVTGNDTYNFALKTESDNGLTFYSREGTPPEWPTQHPLLVINPPEPSY